MGKFKKVRARVMLRATGRCCEVLENMASDSPVSWSSGLLEKSFSFGSTTKREEPAKQGGNLNCRIQSVSLKCASRRAGALRDEAIIPSC